ncbi:MAG: hypothetical protein AAGE59_11565 [Cyanobacteria bacterium P01_F01_bin.86]
MTSSSSSSSVTLSDRFVAVLESHIQEVMAQKTETPPLVRCRFQQGRLLVLSETLAIASTASERDRQFRTLALSIRRVLAETELPEGILAADGTLPMRLYLRQQGTASPYAARSWKWQSTDVISGLFGQAGSTSASDEAGAVGEAQAGSLVLVSSPMESIEVEPDPLDTLESEAPEANIAPPQDSSAPQDPPLSVPVPAWRQRWQTWQATWQDLPWRSVVGLTAAGLLLGGITYGASRPCLIGNCNRRQTASDLSQAAVAQMQDSPTLSEVNLAHKDLLKAVRLLAGIPPWSPHYDTAQAELFRYRTQLSDLEWIMSAQKHAATAAEKSQDPPHPVPQWSEIHFLWRKAVTDLRRVPSESPLVAFAQKKLVEYEANYETIGNRLSIEEQAEANLNAALQAGQLANTQVEKATTLPQWLVAQQEWQRAVNALSQIPQGTLAYDEARSLLEEYRIQLVETRTVVNLEKAGDRTYQTGLTSATAAQEAAQANQWTLAVEQWRRAITHLRQVPEATIPYADAQSRLKTYQASLEQAQNNLKRAVALQTVDDDLIQLCPIELGVCTFSYNSRQIELILRNPYDSAVRQSISPPSTQGHLTQTTSVVEQTHQLVQDIMRIGNRVQLPIILYDTNRRFIARYKPEYGGFVKQP